MSMWFWIVDGVLLALLALCGVMTYRNWLVYRYSRIAAMMTHKAANVLVYADIDHPECWREAWNIYDSYPSYTRMWLNLFAWKFEHFYPNLETRLNEIVAQIARGK